MYVKNSAGGGRKYSKANLAKQEEEEEAGRSSTPGYLYYILHPLLHTTTIKSADLWRQSAEEGISLSIH